MQAYNGQAKIFNLDQYACSWTSRTARPDGSVICAILASQARGEERSLRLVADYSMPNVSDKVVRIIHSYTDYVNRVVWKKY